MYSSYKYIDGSIKFSNVYICGTTILYLTLKEENIPTIYKSTHRDILPIIIKRFDSIESLNTFTKSLAISGKYEIGAIGDNMWYGNIGHALFDGLYPIYLAMVKFGYSDIDFTYFTHSWHNMKTLSTEVITKFSNNKIYNLTFDTNHIVFCKTLFSGFGDGKSLCGNCVINQEYTLYGQKEYNALKLFRNRILKSFGISQSNKINDPIKVLVINNKRFSKEDLNILDNLVNICKDKFNIKFIDWYHDYSSFDEQLHDFYDTDIQITGPGTGMLYAPFLKDGSININLGQLECINSRMNTKLDYKDKDSCYPSWMEQCVCAGCDYINTIYYDRINYNNLELSILIDLLYNSLEILGKKCYNNLNTDAIIFKHYCQQSGHGSTICKHLTDIGYFIELFVNEHPNAILPIVNLELLRKLKQKFNYPQHYSITE